MKIAHYLGASALAGTLLLSAPAFGQAAPNVSTNPATPGVTQEAREVEQDRAASADGQERDDNTIVVTGSRIPRPENDGNIPGVQIDSVAIQTRGFTNALEVLNDIPLVGPGASPLTGNNGGQTASLGAAFVDLLDLGTQRTLTLVNGRRFVSGNSASLFVEGNSTGSQVDVNVIPAALIQRVDVLTVGGAAAYGSDAIAGVVNYILRDDYEGQELRLLSGISERGDAAQYTVAGVAGRNFLDKRLNITLAAEYNRSEGVQANQRQFRLARPAAITNFANGGVRNTTFAPNGTIVDVTGANNGAFLRNTDDGQPANLFIQGFSNLSISLNGTVLNTLATPVTPYVPISQTTGGVTRTSNYITLQNGLGTPTGQIISTPNGNISPANNTFFTTATQIVNGLPGAPSSLIANDGRNGFTGAQPANLPITTFAPTALPTGVTAAQVFAQFGVTPPAGATAAQQTALAVNVLQQNRFTAREFLAANPTVNPNAFLGTFIPAVPRVANTDTTPVTVRNGNGTTTTVPYNVVLPFVAVPIEFTADGQVRTLTAPPIGAATPALFTQAPGYNGGFIQGPDTVVLRTQQDRFIANFIGKFEISNEVTLFTENLYARQTNVSLSNQASNNSISTSVENAALVLNVNNPYLDAADRAALAAVGITPAVRGGSFSLTRINQDIFGQNPFTAKSETYRFVGGARSRFDLLGQSWNAEISATYGRAKQRTFSTNLLDIEYQLALDAVDQGLATTGVANGNIVCRAQVFPTQYLGRTPNGTVGNLTRLPGAGGIPTETVVTPTITQDQITRCQPLNPFGYNQMSAASKAYVTAPTQFYNLSQQTFLQASVGGNLFELPGGPLGVNFNGEFRREELFFTSDNLNQLGRSRTAPSGTTKGYIEAFEVGGEARIPIFGDGFLPFLGSAEFTPAVRISQQSGKGSQYRNIAGQVIQPSSNGDPATIYSLGGRWTPIRDITFRGNYTRSIRQPGVVELFLGGQPAFAVATDVCGPAAISGGTSATRRRANCRAAVRAAGLAGDDTAADNFLTTFVPNNISLPGQFAGGSGLKPEKGKSWTVGGVLTPRFLPGFSLSADYISLDLKDQIVPLTPTQAIQFCYDSATYPDTSPQNGSNLCGFFSRGPDFQIQPGFSGSYINLSAAQIRAINISGRYNFKLPGSLGDFTLRGNAYHLIRFTESSAGDFSDSTQSAGTFARPQWEVQLSGRYESEGGFYTQLTANWRDRTKLFTNGAPATIEFASIFRYPRTTQFDLTVGADVNDRFRLQGTVINLTDKIYAGDLGFFNTTYLDQIGRRFQVTAFMKF